MDGAIRQPAFAVARVDHAAGDPVRAESGAVMATSSGVGVTASTGGGWARRGRLPLVARQ